MLRTAKNLSIAALDGFYRRVVRKVVPIRNGLGDFELTQHLEFGPQLARD
jgi:hypothetical protein